jgi:hypothetical protein
MRPTYELVVPGFVCIGGTAPATYIPDEYGAEIRARFNLFDQLLEGVPTRD